jgi:CheY-like chemotaxis protein
LLESAQFDLILMDGFSSTPRGALTAAAPVLRAAATTPVALFSGHTFAPEHVREAGFRGIITKPFDIDHFERQVQAFLND